MKCLLLFLATAGIANGWTYDGFRAKWSWSSALVDKENFFNIPRQTSLADGDGWRRVERAPGSLLPDLRMYCRPDDVTVCPLFDPSGYVAGVQIAIPSESLSRVPGDHSKKLMLWKSVTAGNSTRDYWTSAVFFVSEESLKRGSGPRMEGGSTLQDDSIWTTNLASPDKLMRIPLREADMNKTTLYKKANCIANMGTHYYYNTVPNLDCAEWYPWFLLVKEGKLIGVGFQLFGTPAQIGERKWLEDISSRGIKVVMPAAPPCVEEWTEKYDLISLHMHFIDKPWFIKCDAGDSAQPVSVVNKLLLNADRYATVIADEAKKIFG